MSYKRRQLLLRKDNRVQVKLMVGEVVLQGISIAMGRNAFEAVQTTEAELLAVKHQLQEQNSAVNRLIHAIRKKDDVIAELVEQINRRERRLVMYLLTERERVLAKAKEVENFVARKEKELLQMAESIVELAMKLDGESKRVLVLERRLKQSETDKGRETIDIMEKTELLEEQKDSAIEIVKREGRLMEFRANDSSVEKENSLCDQIQRIHFVESAEEQLREELHVQTEIRQLMQAGKDNSVLPQYFKTGKKSVVDEPYAREQIVKSLQGDMDLSNNGNLELIIIRSVPAIEIKSQNVHTKTEVLELPKHEEIRAQAVSNSEQLLKQELTRMSATLQEYVEATQCLKIGIGYQFQKHAFETGPSVEGAAGKVVDLVEDRPLFRGDFAGNHRERVTFPDRMLHKSHGEHINVQTFKVELEETLNDLNTVTEKCKKKVEKKDKMPDGAVQLSRQMEYWIFHPKEKLTEKEYLLDYKNDSGQRTRQEESMKKQQLSEEYAKKLREAKIRISFLEQEVAVQEGSLEKYRIEIEEQLWRFEFVEKFLSTYVEDSFEDFLKHIVDIQGSVTDVQQNLLIGQNELEVLQEKLRGCREKVDTTKPGARASLNFVDQLQLGAKSYIPEFASVKVEVQDARSPSEREPIIIDERQEEMDSLVKKPGETVFMEKDKVIEMLQNLEESEWRFLSILLGLVEGSTQERATEFASLREELKLTHQGVPSQSSDVEEQRDRLTSYVSDMSDSKSALLSQNNDLFAFRQWTELISAIQRDIVVREQAIVKGTLKDNAILKKMKVTLVIGLEEEKQKVQQLQEESNLLIWRNQVELEMLTTVFLEARADLAVISSSGRFALLGEAQIHHELGGKEPNVLIRRSLEGRCDGLTMESLRVPIQLATGKGEATNIKKSDEIDTLKSDFCMDVEKIERERKSDNELGRPQWESSGRRCAGGTVEGGRGLPRVVTMTMEVPCEQERGAEYKVRWEKGKSNLMEPLFQTRKDEWSTGISSKPSYGLDKQETDPSTKVSLVAALEKEKTSLNSAHEKHEEKVISYYKELLEEKDTVLNPAFEEIGENCNYTGELEVEHKQCGDEILVLRTEMGSILKQLKSDLVQMQALVASSEQLENHVLNKINQYNGRLECAQGLVNHRLRQYIVRPLSEAWYLQGVQNLEKAETEVDMLGDEVDALMDILERVYSVLNHYSTIFQHYPGLAELVKVVRHEILPRSCDFNEGSWILN